MRCGSVSVIDNLAKEYILYRSVEIRKNKIYDNDSGPDQQLHSQSSSGEGNNFSQKGTFCHNGRFVHSF